ncbi:MULTISPECIES: glycosyl hydrolase-related protein [unclassified Arcicella]|uniref:glycosyl hydrolase-related protein n=1 Tax=unclassified Arcicella TaxID=2644986 RepID=UPI002856AD23|nr:MULTISPECIES: glycoside hydrolase [unclassified Arcicella]MDR6562117.1 alpha-mannosidase [Arcicella sp. BE51]MDR6812188.1 alpha-mannosidase [Arcicella sp. BE140]MDR6823500.1 alpha-mannosidase [Arcicella sp. BE139]
MKQILIITFFLFYGWTTHAQQKRLYIANDDHTDYMWTANEAQYDSAFVKMLDFYLNQVDSTKNNAPDFQARFNCDGSYWLRAYQKFRSPAQFNRLMDAVRSGHISSPFNSLVSTYGAQPTEAVLRGMFYAGSLERAYNLRFTLAQAMENNTIPLGLSSLWAGAGVKYSYKGIGGYGSQMTYEYRANRRKQLYHYTGLDGSSVLTKWYDYNEKKYAPFGGYAECRMYPKKRPVSQTVEIEQVIDKLDKYTNNPHYPFNVAAAFGYGWDDLSNFISQPFIEAAQNKTTDTRKVRVSNEADFFEDVAKTYPNLPSESLSYGNEWDIYCASMNETTAKVRRSVEKLRTAEALASLVSLKDKHFATSLTNAKQQAWEALGFYWEHNWTADGPVKRNIRADWQIKLQTHVSSYVDSLFQLASDALGKQIKQSKNARFYVFNPLSWIRNDVADFEYEGKFPVKIVDLTTNQEVANQLISKNGKQYLRIQADNVPSVGYKVFEIRPEKGKSFPNRIKTSGNYISNAFYKLKVSPSGAITELYDIAAKNKQVVLAGKYLNSLGNNPSDGAGTIVVENAGPVSVTLKAVSQKPTLHTVRITLFANNSRIQIEDSIQANFGDVKTWDFAFNLKKQTTRHEELGAIITAKKETRGGHYSAQNARLDWQTFNHFADMSEANYGITLSNQDCSFFKLGESTVDSLWEDSSELHALAGGQVDKKVEDGGMMGIFNQNGQKSFYYNFALTTHQNAFNPTTAMKFSLEHQNPLVAGSIEGSKVKKNENSFSLLSINDPNVLLWSLKPSEEGIENGLITRFWNFDSKQVSPTIKLSKPIGTAWQTTHVETNEQQLTPMNGM